MHMTAWGLNRKLNPIAAKQEVTRVFETLSSLAIYVYYEKPDLLKNFDLHGASRQLGLSPSATLWAFKLSDEFKRTIEGLLVDEEYNLLAKRDIIARMVADAANPGVRTGQAVSAAEYLDKQKAHYIKKDAETVNKIVVNLGGTDIGSVRAIFQGSEKGHGDLRPDTIIDADYSTPELPAGTAPAGHHQDDIPDFDPFVEHDDEIHPTRGGVGAVETTKEPSVQRKQMSKEELRQILIEKGMLYDK